ncbi:anti-sigma factor [Jiangella alkaliphila]|uniref:Regulator of SigK n=1 Tax=Jiangella alkaliphila TaxID=419479 RepID=A0A1H2L888_9ACTN|nr:anti-sigma factor [Jiangella alkaliphila]SDU76935.1 Anti-sigma-K factor RskA [Jiangella alkaliphila]
MTESADAGLHTLAAPYALHALPDDEARAFETHLGACAVCRAEVDELRETAARLGAVTAVTPPAWMKDQLMSRVQEVQPLPPQVAGVEGVGSATVRAARRWWPRVATGLVAALAAGVVVLGVRLGDVQSDLERAERADTQLREIIEAPDVELVRAESGGSHGTALVARSRDIAVLIVTGMEPAPPDETYQLWLIGDTGIRSAGVLDDPDGGRIGPLTAHGLGEAEQMGVTVEPDGGSEQPTTEPVMVIELPA